MTAGAAGAVPDDVIEEVAEAIRESWRIGGRFSARARCVLSVPSVAEVFARVAEAEQDALVYRTALGLACSDGWTDGPSAMESYIETAKTHIAAVAAALYSEDGTR